MRSTCIKITALKVFSNYLSSLGPEVSLAFLKLPILDAVLGHLHPFKNFHPISYTHLNTDLSYTLLVACGLFSSGFLNKSHVKFSYFTAHLVLFDVRILIFLWKRSANDVVFSVSFIMNALKSECFKL
jgi:hypothetical protein